MTSRRVGRWVLGRRRLIGGAAATACVGCGNRDGAPVGARQADDTLPAPAPSDDPVRSVMPGLIDVGPLDDVVQQAASAPLYVANVPGYVVAVGEDDREALSTALDPMLHAGLDAGLLALFQKCPHLGCRIPFCESSGWFECPCHGSRYSPFGEHRDGPGPRGMDAIPIVIEDGRVGVDIGRVVAGLPVGSEVVLAEPLGPHCTSGAAEH